MSPQTKKLAVDLVREIHGIVYQAFKYEGEDQRERDQCDLARALCRGIFRPIRATLLLDDEAGESAEPADAAVIAARYTLHQTFGAPGSWGYDTALGKALQRLYAIDFAS